MPSNRKRLPQKKKRQNVRRKRQSPSSTGFGGLIARGVRTLLSVLPGSSLTTGIADFVFKSLGYSKVLSVIGNEVEVTFQATGLTALFHLKLKDILFESFTHGVRVNAEEWDSNYSAGRLMSLCVKVIPQAPTGQQRGQWALCFIPFRTNDDEYYYNNKSQGMLYEQLKMIPGARSAQANKPMHVMFSPRSNDGRLNFDLDLNKEIGAVGIAFDQTNRSSYGAFGMDEFSCTVIVSGVVRLQRPQEVPYTLKYTRLLDDKLKDHLAIVRTQDRKYQFDILRTNDDKHFITYEEGSIRVKGVVDYLDSNKLLPYSKDLSLEDLEIDG